MTRPNVSADGQDAAVFPPTLEALVSAALQLGADRVAGWSASERQLARRTPLVTCDVERLTAAIREGFDPLGEAFCRLFTPAQRRPRGQTYTPAAVIEAQLNWLEDRTSPVRVVDPGSGSGRYLLAAGQRWPGAELVGTDIDPVATLMTRANLAAAGLERRARVLLGDYRQLRLRPVQGATAYAGNPPYVRHHDIDPAGKQWLTIQARELGLSASQLAGLHVHFFLATAAHAADGDVGSFITASEWLDTNYGKLVRELLLDRLGGHGVHVLEPETAVFADAAATGAITNFQVSSRPTSLRLRRVKTTADLGRLDRGRTISRVRLAEATRWGPLTRVSPKLPDGYVELGELCRVHRGTVTGANSVWVSRGVVREVPEHLQRPTVTKAKELFAAGERLSDPAALRRVVDLPADLDELDPRERAKVLRWLKTIEAGVRDGYVASTRRAWWAVGLRHPAPILATYMARRPPAFVRNLAEARHINVAHGLYPRQPLSEAQLDALATRLRDTATLSQGRTYAGGLVKFEPREMERLPVPAADLLTVA